MLLNMYLRPANQQVQLDKLQNPGLSKSELQKAKQIERERRRRKKAKKKAKKRPVKKTVIQLPNYMQPPAVGGKLKGLLDL